MTEPCLAEEDLPHALGEADASGWEPVGRRLIKAFACRGFVGALAFVEAVGVLAEEAEHHPDIDIRYDRVTLSLTTHDSGGITRRDTALAGQIDRVTAGRS